MGFVGLFHLFFLFYVISCISNYLYLLNSIQYLDATVFFQARDWLTANRALIVCAAMPLLWLAVFSWTGMHVEMTWNKTTGQTTCDTASAYHKEGKAAIDLWTCLYIYIPAALLVVLNIAIAIRLRRARKIHKTIEDQCADQGYQYMMTSDVSPDTTTDAVTGGDDENKPPPVTTSEQPIPDDQHEDEDLRSGLRSVHISISLNNCAIPT